MKVKLIAHTPEPEKIIATAAKLCYSKVGIDEISDNLTEEKTNDFLEMLNDLGHASPTEHVSFTFAIEGVSRALLAQITRHRHASFSVQSQRYVDMSDFDYVTPPSIEEYETINTIFEEAMLNDKKTYNKIKALLTEIKTSKKYTEIERNLLIKKIQEDARFVLPNAVTTKMIVTMNARSLNHFFNLRCCNRAQWEIKELSYKMLELVYQIAPTLFKKSGAPCVSGPCTEGKMTCGKMHEVKEYTAMRLSKTLKKDS